MKLNFKNKNIFVTGSSKGIGFDIAKSFDGNLSNPNYFSAGFVLGPFIIPLYQSWGSEKYPNNLNWLGERIRLKLPIINF